MLRYEVNAPDVLVIFIAFKEDRVQIVVNIFLEFLTSDEVWMKYHNQYFGRDV